MSGLPEATRSSAMDGDSATAHDDRHERIWVRRGICRSVREDLHDLARLAGAVRRPSACVADNRLVSASPPASPLEQAAPHCKDPSRLPDSSTVRRWAQRRLLSVWCWVKAGAIGAHFLRAPTILAWDLERGLPYSADRGKKSMNRQALDELKQQIPLAGAICRRMIGSRRGHSAAADGWGCALCMQITNQASWWTPTKTCSTATAVAAAAT